MALRKPKGGLTHPSALVRNKSNDVAKVSIVVPAGDELEVGEGVAAQLLGQSTAFETVGNSGGSADVEQAEEPAPDSSAAPADEDDDADGGVEEAGGGSARGKSGRRKS